MSTEVANDAGLQKIDQLLSENQELHRRLEEAEDALRALRAGEVDAVFVEAGHEQVLTLETPDKPYRLLVEQMPQGAATLTAEGKIISCNHRFADLLQRPVQSLLGKPILDFVAPRERGVVESLLHNCQQGDQQGEVWLRRADRTRVSAFFGFSALSESAMGTCLLVTDLTEQRNYEELQRTQEALRATSERLELAQQVGGIGTFEWNIASGQVSWSTTEEQLYGLPAGAFGGDFAAWIQALHPEDRARAEADCRRAVREHAGLQTEFRIIRPDGQVRWIAAHGKVFYDATGQPLRMLGVNIDVTERKQTEQALRDADRKKDEFLATLAHELRNPLAPIRNAVQVLKFKGPSHPELEWGRAILERQVQVMARLLEDLLDVSRISRNKLQLRKERIELRTVLNAALETSRPLIEAGGHKLMLTLPPEPIYLDADPLRLSQVFANLLNNAAKYTEDGGHTWLSARREGDQVIVSVRDSGIGIAPEMLPRVFEIFSQSERALARSQGGLGIGLSLVKGLIELHGGTIEAHSEGPGRGSEFVARLPIPADTAAGKHNAPAHDVVQDKPVPAATRILVVDDNRDSTDSLAKLLKIMGHEVSTAYDGEQAVAVAESFRPDVVLLDLGMPRLNGCEACRRIRQQPWGREMTLIAVTGWGQDQDRRRTEEAGFDHHIVKPVDPPALLELLAARAM